MADRRRVLLTVSGEMPEDLHAQVADGRRPRADYTVIGEAAGADIVDVHSALGATGVVGRLLHRVGGAGVLLGWYAFRRRRHYEVVLTDGEQAGIPYSALTRVCGKRGAAHVMIVHILSVPKKERLIRFARLAGQVDRYITYCTAQTAFIRDRLGVPADSVVQSTFMVDTEFFSRDRAPASRRNLISSAGLERRDYPTLMTAVEGLDVDVVIAAASPWSRQHDSSQDRALPSNVQIQRLSLFDLRELYAQSALVVMPLVEVDFQAGITTILEAMSMELPVVCTLTTGQNDTIVDGETGVYVPPGDAGALRSEIETLLADPDRAATIGTNARQWVVAHADVVLYARFVGRVVDELRGSG